MRTDANLHNARVCLAAGSVTLTAGGMLTDSVMQRITFVDPPLVPDYNRDGAIIDAALPGEGTYVGECVCGARH